MKRFATLIATATLAAINWTLGAALLCIATLLTAGVLAAWLVHIGLWSGTVYGLYGGCAGALLTMLVGGDACRQAIWGKPKKKGNVQ